MFQLVYMTLINIDNFNRVSIFTVTMAMLKTILIILLDAVNITINRIFVIFIIQCC